MLQNRVDPLGNIIKTKARGSWMGNRGLLHDEHQQILRPYRLQAWLICLLEFKDRKRPVMAPRRYTELFFLDEATAFSAGHRPCFECRRQDAERFRECWVQGNPHHHFTIDTSIQEIDAILHQERIDHHGFKLAHQQRVDHLGSKRTHQTDLATLPDGVFVLHEDRPHLIADNALFPWTPFGYEERIPMPDENIITILTPPSTVNAFRAGYRPQIQR